MSIFFIFFCAIGWGYLLHVAAPLFLIFPVPIAQLARYASGSSLTFPFVLALASIFLNMPVEVLAAPLFAAYFLGFLGFGAGVFAGYAEDRVRAKRGNGEMEQTE